MHTFSNIHRRFWHSSSSLSSFSCRCDRFFLFSCVRFIFSVDMHVPYSWLFFLLSLNTAPDGRYCQLNLHVKLMRSCWLLRINSFYHFLFDIFDDCYYRHCTIAIAATFPIYAMVTIHAFSWNICFVAHLLLAYKHISKCKKWITLASLSQCIARTHTHLYILIHTYINIDQLKLSRTRFLRWKYPYCTVCCAHYHYMIDVHEFEWNIYYRHCSLFHKHFVFSFHRSSLSPRSPPPLPSSLQLPPPLRCRSLFCVQTFISKPN